MTDNSIQIEHSQDERQGLGTQRQRVALTYQFGRESGSLYIPCDVAKLLQKKLDSETFDCSSPDALRIALADFEMSAARSRLLRLVKQRDRCSFELRQALVRDGYSDACISQTLDWAQQLRIVDDARFAELFVRSKLARGWGRLRIERELRVRDIDSERLAVAFGDRDDADDEYERAFALVSTRALPKLHPYEKSVRFLLNRGFSMSVAKRAARRLCDAHAHS